MTPSTRRTVHAPPRRGALLALALAVATAVLIAACGGSTTSSFGAGGGAGESMGLETPAASGY